MEGNARDIRLYSGTSHPKLAESIANCLGQQLGHVNVERFPDGEIFVQVVRSEASGCGAQFRASPSA